MELLHRQVLALQTQRVLLGMWTGALPRESRSSSQVLANDLPFLHRKAAESFSLAAEPGLPPGHAVPAAAHGGFTGLGGHGGYGSLSIPGRTKVYVHMVVVHCGRCLSECLLCVLSCAKSINPHFVEEETQLTCPTSHTVIEKTHRFALE